MPRVVHDRPVPEGRCTAGQRPVQPFVPVANHNSRHRTANFWLSVAIRLKMVSPNNHCVCGLVRRAHWTGFLKLSLVPCPVTLYPALAASERISFRQINKKTGNRLRQQLVDAVTGEPMQPHNKGRGYEAGEIKFLLVRNENWRPPSRRGEVGRTAALQRRAR